MHIVVRISLEWWRNCLPAAQRNLIHLDSAIESYARTYGIDDPERLDMLKAEARDALRPWERQ